MVQSRFQKLFWNQHFYMVSNLLVEIAIYNFDLFHSALLSISTTKLLNKPLLTGNCACSKSRTSVSCKSSVRGETLPWFLWQQDDCPSSVWIFSTKLSLNLNFPAPPGNLVFAIWSCLGQGFSEEPCEHAIVLNMIVTIRIEKKLPLFWLEALHCVKRQWSPNLQYRLNCPPLAASLPPCTQQTSKLPAIGLCTMERLLPRHPSLWSSLAADGCSEEGIRRPLPVLT